MPFLYRLGVSLRVVPSNCALKAVDHVKQFKSSCMRAPSTCRKNYYKTTKQQPVSVFCEQPHSSRAKVSREKGILKLGVRMRSQQVACEGAEVAFSVLSGIDVDAAEIHRHCS